MNNEDIDGEDSQYYCIRCGENYFRPKKSKIVFNVFSVLKECMKIVHTHRLKKLTLHVEIGREEVCRQGEGNATDMSDKMDIILLFFYIKFIIKILAHVIKDCIAKVDYLKKAQEV